VNTVLLLLLLLLLLCWPILKIQADHFYCACMWWSIPRNLFLSSAKTGLLTMSSAMLAISLTQKKQD
jgi:hypothetical protein